MTATGPSGAFPEEIEAKRRALAPAVQALLLAPTTERLAEVIAAHPELADPAADMVAFMHIAELFVGDENQMLANALGRRVRLLRVTRRDGIDAALADFRDEVLAAQPPGLRGAWEAAASVPQREAAGAWTALLSHAGFDQADQDFQRLALDSAIAARRQELAAAEPKGDPAGTRAALARLYRDGYILSRQPAELDEAISAYRTAIAALPPDHAEVPALLIELASGLHTRSGKTGDPADLDAAIDGYQRAATHGAARHALRARAANERGLLLIGKSERGGSTSDLADLDAAIESFGLAVQESGSAGEQELYADSLSNLTHGHWARYQRLAHPADLDAAAGYAAAAVERLPPGSPRLTGRLGNLALVQWELFQRTGSRDALDSTVDAHRRLTASLPPGTARLPEALADLGRALRRRHELSGDPSDVDAAVTAFRAAIAQTSHGSPASLGYLLDLGTVLAARYEANGSAENLDEAIAVFRQIIDEGPGNSHWTRALGNLGGLLSFQYENTGNPAYLDESVTALTEAARASAGTPAEAGILQNLAGALQRRYFVTGRMADLERFTELQHTVLGLTAEDSPGLAERLAGLGRALHTAGTRSAAPQDIDTVIGYHKRAIELASNPIVRSHALGYLGDALLDRHERGADPADLDAAIDNFTRAVEAAPPGAPMLGRQLNRLANALAVRSDAGRDCADMDAAVATYRRALGLQNQPAAVRAETLLSFGVALLGRRETAAEPGQTTEPGQINEAVSALREGCVLGAETSPQAVMHAAHLWGDWALDRRSWPEAAEAYRAALAALTRIIESDPGREHHQSWLHSGRDLADSAAYAFARCDDLDAAVLTLERWRATLLTAALDPRAAPRKPAVPVATRTADEATLAYLAATRAGGIALLVHPGGQPDAVWLPELSSAELAQRAWDYLSRQGAPGWAGEIDELTRWLWTAAMGPVLTAAPVAPEATLPDLTRHLVLILGGVLGLLPLHAAWTHDPAAVTGRRYALDVALLTYAGNARVLDSCRKAAVGITVRTLLAVGDASSLAHARQELDAVSACFPDVTRPGDASADEVLAALGGHQVLHFACHGVANPGDPLASALLTAPGERLTMGQVLSRGVPGTRLAVLSACETAIPGADLLDEAVGMPSSFIQAGAAAAIGSLWEVPDEATMMLMTRFYELWRTDGLPPARALRLAQQWVRDSTNVAKLRRFPDIAESADTLPEWARDDWEEGRKHASPWHWASFVYVGA